MPSKLKASGVRSSRFTSYRIRLTSRVKSITLSNRTNWSLAILTPTQSWELILRKPLFSMILRLFRKKYRLTRQSVLITTKIIGKVWLSNKQVLGSSHLFLGKTSKSSGRNTCRFTWPEIYKSKSNLQFRPTSCVKSRNLIWSHNSTTLTSLHLSGSRQSMRRWRSKGLLSVSRRSRSWKRCSTLMISKREGSSAR